MSNFEYDYLDLVSNVALNGSPRETRAGKTRALFGTTLTIDTGNRFPILTTRQMYYMPVWAELAAFITGTTELKVFKNFGCNYWDANAAAWEKNKDKDLADMSVGKIYGAQWRDFNGVDQLRNLLFNLKYNPNSRRHILTTANPADEKDMCLPPCHLLAQFHVEDDQLYCCVYMRSVDLCLGLPSDILLYSTLQRLIAAELNLYPGKLVFMMGDTHIYTNHLDTFLTTQNEREPLALPVMKFSDSYSGDMFSFTPYDVYLTDYKHQGVLKYEFNV